VLLGCREEVSNGGVTTDAATSLGGPEGVRRRLRRSPVELDAGQSSRAGLSAAAVVHDSCIGRFVEWLFMCTSSVLALERS